VRTALAPYDQPLDRGGQLRRRAVRAARRVIPAHGRRSVRRAAARARPALTALRLYRPVEPLSRHFGYDRGQPVDRWYIERFLAENAGNICGTVLEVGSDTYTQQFGGRRVQRSEVLNVDPGDPQTTFVADLADAPTLPSGAFDCVILTQTLHLIFDLEAAVRTVHRILRRGGVALVTVPGISPISRDRWAETWFWSLTPLAAERLFGDVFGIPNVEVAAWGNVASAVAFLQGRSARELRAQELEVVDPQYPLLVTIRAFRPGMESGVQ
jgi:SAM-dependent methyltransferase